MQWPNRISAFFVVILFGALAEPYTHGQPQARHGLHYQKPATVWDEAMPLGNGLLAPKQASFFSLQSYGLNNFVWTQLPRSRQFAG